MIFVDKPTPEYHEVQQLRAELAAARAEVEKLKEELATEKLVLFTATEAAERDRELVLACDEAEITTGSKVLKGRSEWRIIKAILARREGGTGG